MSTWSEGSLGQRPKDRQAFFSSKSMERSLCPISPCLNLAVPDGWGRFGSGWRKKEEALWWECREYEKAKMLATVRVHLRWSGMSATRQHDTCFPSRFPWSEMGTGMGQQRSIGQSLFCDPTHCYSLPRYQDTTVSLVARSWPRHCILRVIPTMLHT